VVAALGCVLGALYLLGGRRPVRVLDQPPRWSARHWRAVAFFSGLFLAVLLIGSADRLARQSFSARIAERMILVMVAAPLLVLGSPWPRWRRLIGLGSRTDARGLWLPALAFVLFNSAILLAFIPPIYRATAAPGLARELGQLALVALGFLFWSQAIAQPPGHCRLSHLGRIVYLFLSSAQLRILGLVLGFAPAPFYGVPLVDQQIAAGIVMVPGVLTDLVVLTVCLYLWLGQDDRRQIRRSDPGGRRLAAVPQRVLAR